MSSIGATIDVLAVVLLLATLAAIATVYHKLSSMTQALRLELQQRVDGHFSQVEGILAMYARQGGLAAYPVTRGWAASPDMLHQVILHVQHCRPKMVLECSSGVSTLVLAHQMRAQGYGQVVSLENSAEYAEKTRAHLQVHGLEDFAQVIHAPFKRQTHGDWTGDWYDVAGLPGDLQADLLVIDGPPSTTAALARYPALPALKNRLASGAAVILDDANRAEEQTIVKRWIAETPGMAQAQTQPCEKGIAMLFMPLTHPAS